MKSVKSVKSVRKPISKFDQGTGFDGMRGTRWWWLET